MPTATLPALDEFVLPPPASGPVADIDAATERLSRFQLAAVAKRDAAKQAVEAAWLHIDDATIAGRDIAAALAAARKAAIEYAEREAELQLLSASAVRLMGRRRDAERNDDEYRTWSTEQAQIRKAYHEAIRPRLDTIAANPADERSTNPERREQYRQQAERHREKYDETVAANLAGLAARIQARRTSRRTSVDAGMLRLGPRHKP